MKPKYYDTELLNYFNTCTTSTAFGLQLGCGKTSTMIKYLYDQAHQNPEKRILVIVNNVANLKELHEKLNYKYIDIWYHDRKTKKGKPYLYSYAEESTRLAITKSKFFNLLIQEDYSDLHTYDEYFWDEFTGLSPLTVSEFIRDFSNITIQLKKTQHTRLALDIINFLQQILQYFEEVCVQKHIVYQAQILKSHRETATSLLKKYLKHKQDYSIEHPLYLQNELIVILRAIRDDTMWMSQYSPDGSTLKYYIAVRDDTIKTFIKQKKMYILDATAYFNKDMYNYLGIQTISQFTRNTIDFSDITVHIHHIHKDIQAYHIRNGYESQLEQLHHKIDNTDIHTFVPKRAYQTLLEKFGYAPEKLFYFFSGKDIGSNEFRHITEMNIIAAQTYPRILRILYNHIVFDMKLEQAQQLSNDKAEMYLMSTMIAQLIGRTNHREHQGNSIHIHTYAVEPSYIYFIKNTYFKGCHIIEHNKPVEIKGKKRVNTIFTAIHDKLETSTKNIVYIDTILDQYIQNPKKLSIFCTNHKQKFIDIAKTLNYTYKKEHGKYPIFTKIPNKRAKI